MNLLLPHVAAGDHAALRSCIQRYRGLIWTLARRFTRTHAEAEDAVQDVIVDLWRSAHRFDARVASEVSFVGMIARRRLIDRMRKRARRPHTESLDERVQAPSCRGNAHIEAAAEATVAVRAMATLRPAQAQVLLMSTYHGMSHSEIAASTGMPLGTVKAHARRGMNRVRQLLAA